MSIAEWREPALLWNGDLNNVSRPDILEIRQDDFISVFLTAMGSANPGRFLQEHRMQPANLLKLYQPLHGCYYLVTASLVCRQMGLPDKTIRKADGESISFVIRRINENGEDAWIQDDDGGSWQPVAPDDVLTVLDDEEQFPMHPVAICPRPEEPQSPFTDFIQRDLHYGYIPTGNRKKYLEVLKREMPAETSAAETVADFVEEAEAAYSTYNFRKDMYLRRVHSGWEQFVRRVDNDPPQANTGLMPADESEIQLYVLLELGDFIKTYVPTLWDALEANADDDMPDNMDDAFEMLTDATQYAVNNDDEYSLRDALIDLEDHFDLVRGIGNEPAATYNIEGTFSSSVLDVFHTAIDFAIDAEDRPIELPDAENSELARLIRNQVRPTPTTEQRYYIRTVYEYDPECLPVVSQLPGRPFILAKLFEPDAPARLLQIEAPSVKLKDLRRYSRGVGISMSPELHKLASCMKGGDMDGVIDSLTDTCSNGLNIQMVCTFSIQIIFLVAFVVMFIFLISLNFIFWWLAFLRICLPIPTRD